MRIISVVRYLFLALLLLAVSATSFAQIRIGISVGFAPPPIPVYEQPICPGDGFLWTPGYWAWDADGDDYYWVPGTWVEAPVVGFLWTPGYWGWRDRGYFFYEGYWGRQVGWYGGISYGFGYFGHGYEGGRWDGGHFFYNRSVNNVNVTEIHNVYNTTIVNRNENRVSYNGGNGGINERPSAQDTFATLLKPVDLVLPKLHESHSLIEGNRLFLGEFASVNFGLVDEALARGQQHRVQIAQLFHWNISTLLQSSVWRRRAQMFPGQQLRPFLRGLHRFISFFPTQNKKGVGYRDRDTRRCLLIA